MDHRRILRELARVQGSIRAALEEMTITQNYAHAENLMRDAEQRLAQAIIDARQLDRMDPILAGQ